MTSLVAGHADIADLEQLQRGLCRPELAQTIHNHLRGCEECRRAHDLLSRGPSRVAVPTEARERRPGTNRQARLRAYRQRLLWGWVLVLLAGASVAAVLLRANW